MRHPRNYVSPQPRQIQLSTPNPLHPQQLNATTTTSNYAPIQHNNRLCRPGAPNY